MSLLLFVIDMEYLSRILKTVGDIEDFHFHPRCSKLKLNHLIFADDLMIFGKGDIQAIKFLNKGVEIFSSSSELVANNSKSRIYLIGVTDDFRTLVVDSFDFSFERLSVKYLGMPLTSKRYTTADYDYLVERMTAHIRSWYARKVLYAARLQLVNSILMSISNYWSQTVILPKRAVNQINATYRSYLWHREADSRSPRNVNWEKVCRPKNEGGLDIRNLQVRNLATVGKIA